MRPLCVVANGGWRTGSTVAFNIVRLLLERAGAAFTAGLRSHPFEVEADIDRHERNGAWAALKSHVWMPALGRAPEGLRVVYTCRDPYDVAASLLRHWPSWADIVAEVQRQRHLTRYHLWAEVQRIHRPLVLDYEALYGADVHRVHLIAAHLGLDITPADAAVIVQETDAIAVRALQARLARGEQDEDTLVQHDHVGAELGSPGIGREILGAERTRALTAALAVMDCDAKARAA